VGGGKGGGKGEGGDDDDALCEKFAFKKQTDPSQIAFLWIDLGAIVAQ